MDVHILKVLIIWIIKDSALSVCNYSNDHVNFLRVSGVIILLKDHLGEKLSSFDLILHFTKYVDCSELVQFVIWKDPNGLLFILREPAFTKSGYKHNMSSLKANIIVKSLILMKSWEMDFLRNTEKVSARFLICCLVSYTASLTKKFWSGQWGHMPIWPPEWGHSKTSFCPFLGWKIPKIKNFFPLK